MSYAFIIDISCFMWHGKDKNKKLEKTCASQKCKLPNTVPVQYPNIVGVNVDTYRAAAYGAYAGDAVYGRGGYGCGCNNYWG